MQQRIIVLISSLFCPNSFQTLIMRQISNVLSSLCTELRMKSSRFGTEKTYLWHCHRNGEPSHSGLKARDTTTSKLCCVPVVHLWTRLSNSWISTLVRDEEDLHRPSRYMNVYPWSFGKRTQKQAESLLDQAIILVEDNLANHQDCSNDIQQLRSFSCERNVVSNKTQMYHRKRN